MDDRKPWTKRPALRAGQTVGYWTILERSPSKSGTNNEWLCRCVCGCERAVKEPNLQEARTKSCGCMSNALRVEAIKRHKLNRKD